MQLSRGATLAPLCSISKGWVFIFDVTESNSQNLIKPHKSHDRVASAQLAVGSSRGQSTMMVHSKCFD